MFVDINKIIKYTMNMQRCFLFSSLGGFIKYSIYIEYYGK